MCHFEPSQEPWEICRVSLMKLLSWFDFHSVCLALNRKTYMAVLVSQVSIASDRQPGGLNLFSQLWRPEVWNYGVARVGSFWSSEGESISGNPSQAFLLAFGGCWPPLACRHMAVIPASVFTWLSPLCSSLLIRTLVLRFRACRSSRRHSPQGLFTDSRWYLFWSTDFPFFFFFFLMACGILVPQPGIKPGPLAVRAWFPTINIG